MLSQLIAGAAKDAMARREITGFAALEREASVQKPALDALAFLAPAERVKIIAEVKHSSFSQDDLASAHDSAALAAVYQSAGASAISVLAERRQFGGPLQDLEQVRSAVTIPVLHNDFVTLDYQILEARAAGADLVLLIVAAVDQSTLKRLHELIDELGMTAFIETHSADEVERALDVGACLIGVNAHNLTTREFDKDLFARLADRIPAGVIRVAGSAVTSAADVAHYRKSGADVVWVTEAPATADPARALEEFLGVA